MNPVVHFELPYEDGKRATDFYAKAFGWESQMLGPEMGNYVTVSTSETDPETNLPKEPGRINGGLFQKTEDPRQGGKVPTVVIAVDDIHQATKEVEAAGGKVLGGAYKPGEPDDIPGVGLYSSFIDTEGNRMGMLQPHQM
jgi:hypothetical protein